ncbi:telomeric repeat-binding factor 1 [Colossoma macropomum]|uniref:telomeric repeat-binding factor 1 n=1 Tax=Colossoma macropomum TaxID=42526 RepID=UPI001864AE72|nr:telomeric repeat-binding factor 1 [Colossoma macropomum]
MCEVESVARCWMMDFCFRSVCSSYRDTNREKFNQNIRLYEVIVDSETDLQDDQQTKRTVCCFLSRIMDGKNLEVRYDTNDRIAPLMSALTVWENLKDTVADAALYENIKRLLFIQCVGVCLEKGNVQLAAETLEWLEKETSLSEKLQRKLSTLVTKNNVYDQLFTSFSYSRLLDSINTFLDAFLEKCPSDFLLKSATKVVQARQERTERAKSEQELSEAASPSHTAATKVVQARRERAVSPSHTVNSSTKPKKKLFSTKVVHPWKPETEKKPLCVLRRKSTLKVSRLSFKDHRKQETPRDIPDHPKYKSKRRWTETEDKHLKAGVKRYGEGKWAKILEEFVFEDRTSVMLKDRWRTMKKHGML